MDNYLSKPFEVQHIQRMLRERLDVRSFSSTQGVPPNEALGS
jgi:hypothetical protein